MSIHTKNNKIIKVDDELIPLIGKFNDTNMLYIEKNEEEINSAIEAVQLVYDLEYIITDFNEATINTDLESEYQEIKRKYSEWSNIIICSNKAYEYLNVKDEFINKAMTKEQPCGYYEYRKKNGTKYQHFEIFNSVNLFIWGVNMGIITENTKSIVNLVDHIDTLDEFKYMIKKLKPSSNDIIEIFKGGEYSENINKYILATYFGKNVRPFEYGLGTFEEWLKEHPFIEPI